MLNLFKPKDRVIQKGQVYVVTDQGIVLPRSVLDKHEIRKDSKQLSGEETNWLEQNKLHDRRFSSGAMMNFYDSILYFKVAVNQIATDVLAQGYILELREGAKESNQEKDRILAFLDKPNPESTSLRKLCEPAMVDWGINGDFGFEVVRNNKLDVAEIYHLNVGNIKRHEDMIRFCQASGQEKRWFARYTPKPMEGMNQEDKAKVWPPKSYDPKTGKEGDFSVEERANEIIFIKTYDPKNKYFGLPPASAALGELLSWGGVRDFNLSFFENYGVPAYFVTLTGDWADDSAKQITQFLNTEIKGSENQHKTMVMQVPLQTVNGEILTGAVKFEPLSVDIKEGSFTVFREALKEDMLAIFSMPLYRAGISRPGTLGGTNIIEAGQIYKQSVVDPLQEDLEHVFNLIFATGMDCPSYQIKFNDIDVKDENEDVKRYISLFGAASMTPNQILKAMGLPGYAGGNRYYLASNLVEVGEDDEDM